MKWLPAHRGDITQGAAERLPSNPLRFILREIVDALDNAIGLQQEQLADSVAPDDRAIVAGPHDRASPRRKIGEKDVQ
jgi:hypothetical protein